MDASVMFHMKNGENTSDRLEPDLVKAVVETLMKHGVEYEGQKLTVKPFSDFGFDIEGLPGFDHIEFKINKTGWGKWVAPNKGIG